MNPTAGATLPGARHLPIVTRTRHGIRLATADEIRAIERREACGMIGDVLTDIENGREIAVWRLSPADFADRHVIWRLAAQVLDFGYDPDAATLVHGPDGWTLVSRVKAERSGSIQIVSYGLPLWGCDDMPIADATARLCAHVWGAPA